MSFNEPDKSFDIGEARVEARQERLAEDAASRQMVEEAFRDDSGANSRSVLRRLVERLRRRRQ